jgi:tryptophanase
MRQVREVADKAGIMIVLDASLIGENAWFIKQREDGYHHKGMGAIICTAVRTCTTRCATWCPCTRAS